MTDKEILEELKASDLPQPYKKYADTIGIDNFVKLSDLIGGKKTYFPSPLSLVITINRKKMVQEYMEGKESVKSLADKYNISCKTVYKYIARYKNDYK